MLRAERSARHTEGSRLRRGSPNQRGDRAMGGPVVTATAKRTASAHCANRDKRVFINVSSALVMNQRCPSATMWFMESAIATFCLAVLACLAGRRCFLAHAPSSAGSLRLPPLSALIARVVYSKRCTALLPSPHPLALPPPPQSCAAHSAGSYMPYDSQGEGRQSC